MPDWLLVPFARFSNLFARQVLQAIVVDPATLPDEVVAEFVRESRSPGGGMAYGWYNQATVGRTRLVTTPPASPGASVGADMVNAKPKGGHGGGTT